MIGGLASLPWPIYMLFCGFHIGGGFFLTSCVQRQCGCLSCLTPERRVAQKKGCSRQDGKILLAEWRFFRIDANVPLPHVYFGKQLQLTHKAQVRIRWKWPPRYSGKPQDNIEIKNAVHFWTASQWKIWGGETRQWQWGKRNGHAIPEQDNDRH